MTIYCFIFGCGHNADTFMRALRHFVTKTFVAEQAFVWHDTGVYAFVDQIRNTLTKTFIWNLNAIEIVHDIKSFQAHLPQVSHLNGFSPLWIRSWLCNVDNSLKARPHVLQMYGLSSLWYSKCLWYDCWKVKVLLHVWHLYGISPKLCFNM